ncbi:MAG TPA: CvpA family protein, partial [Solirubrobacteraceae bacterium]
MTTLDWVIVAFTAVVACYGFLQGFIVGALSLVGFGVGAVLGTRLGPALLPQGAKSPYAPLFGLAGALLAGGVLAMGLEGLGLRVRQSLRVPGLGVVDGL